MNIGMLWFDNDRQVDLVTRIERAAIYYQSKYGQRPNLCYIHPCMAPHKSPQDQLQAPDLPVLKTGNILVRATRLVLPNHLWIGVDSSLN